MENQLTVTASVRDAQRHSRKPAVDAGGALAAVADGLAMFLQFGAMQVFGDGFMRGWLAGDDEVVVPVGGSKSTRRTGDENPDCRIHGLSYGHPRRGAEAGRMVHLRPG